MKKGWIKQYRREIDDLQELSDQEYRYFRTSCLACDWDKKHLNFGTFDARIETMKKILPWSNGKISEVKNALLEKGYYRKLSEHRLRILNPELIFGKSVIAEKILHDFEGNIHLTEKILQKTEELQSVFKIGSSQLANKMKAF